MELDNRKKQILNAIIQNYQETGEPVGSRTISKLMDTPVSAATIRNEMADLEEMGLIVQPHTSAGRIPTDKAYRMYVNRIMEQDKEARQAEQQKTQLPSLRAESLFPEKEETLVKRMDRVEELLMQMARILADNTKYATMVTGPHYESNKVKYIQLSPMDDRKLLCVVVLGGNVVKNNILTIKDNIEAEDLLQLNLLLNSNLNGLSIAEINLGIISRLKEEAGSHGEIVSKVLDAVAEAIGEENQTQIYTSGTPNIFKYPELTGGDKASELISTLEQKADLGSVLQGGAGDPGDKHEIQVLIGDEVPVESMKDCSVVTATYELENGVKGKIGIIGPKRMDYKKVVDTLQHTMTKLDGIFKK